MVRMDLTIWPFGGVGQFPVACNQSGLPLKEKKVFNTELSICLADCSTRHWDPSQRKTNIVGDWSNCQSLNLFYYKDEQDTHTQKRRTDDNDGADKKTERKGQTEREHLKQ